MILSRKLINAFKQEAINDFGKIYMELFNDDNFEKYLDNFVQESINSLVDYEQIEYRLITSKVSYIRKIKQTMFQSFVGSSFKGIDLVKPDKPSTIREKKKDKATLAYEKLMNMNLIELTPKAPQELLVIQEVYLKFTSVNTLADNFKKLYNAENFTEYIKKITTEMIDWALDNKQCLCSYKYINSLSKFKIKNWFNKDIDLLFFKFIYEGYLNDKLDFLMDMSPIDYLNVPIDPSNKRTTTIREGNTFLHIHEVSEHIRVKTIIDIPNADNDTSPQKLLNLFDKKIVKTLTQLANEDFFSTRKVVCNFGDIVKAMSPSRSDKVYKEVHDSLRKISSYQSIYENDITKENITYDIFKADIVTKEEYEEAGESNNKIEILDETSATYQGLVVKVTFSEKYIARLLEGAIFVSRDIETLYKSNMAQALVIPLQCERYKKFNDNNLMIKLGFNSFFNAVLTLGTANKSRSLKQIEKALEEIHASENIIKSFYRNKDFFYIEFYPLFKDEREGLLNFLGYLSNMGTQVKLPFKINKNSPLDF